MAESAEVVITGLGVVSPIGAGRQPFWASLEARRSGIGPISRFDTSSCPFHFGGEIRDFDPKLYVKPRKSLKVMSWPIQLAVAAAGLAVEDAGLELDRLDHDRCGVICGADVIKDDLESLEGPCRACAEGDQFHFERWYAAAERTVFPLWLLRLLPNMPACHVAISVDARGPCNSLTHGEVSSLMAVAEGMRVIQRGWADLMIVGGTGCRVNPVDWVRSTTLETSLRNDAPARACRPFDLARDGMVHGEGSAMFVLESRRHAVARRAAICGTLAGFASRFGGRRHAPPDLERTTSLAIAAALREAGWTAGEVGFVSARGIGTRREDAAEARAIAAALGDPPVFAPKSYFGFLGAGGGAVELAAAVLAMVHRRVPATLNFEQPDPECPVRVSTAPAPIGGMNSALVLGQAATGQAVALAVRGE